MQYKIKHACGHEQIHDLFRAYNSRDEKAKWLATGDCRKCYRAYLDAQPPSVRAYDSKSDKNTLLITNSYKVKDTLKQRGYQFEKVALVYSGKYPQAGWLLVCKTKSEFEDELSWINAQGWQVSVQNRDYDLLC